MISELPTCVEWLDWRELSPEEGKRRLRFEAFRIAVTLDAPLTKTISFRDRHGVEWARFAGPVFSLAPRYRWNGCSPKRWVPFFGWIGTPDCRGDLTGRGGSILASGIHDAMSQFQKTQHFPLSRKEIDVCFYDILKLAGFPLALPYFSAVRAAENVWQHKDNGEHSVLLQPLKP